MHFAKYIAKPVISVVNSHNLFIKIMIFTGIFGVPKQMVAEAAYDALMKLEHQIRAGTVRKIQSIHYVNLDAEATAAFTEVFSALQMSQQCGDFSPDRAAGSLDFQRAADHGLRLESSSFAPSVEKSSGGKHERRLKVTDVVTETSDSAAAMDTSKKQKIYDRKTGEMQSTDANEDCVICMCPMTQPKKLACGHSFCADCIDESFKKCQPKCPSCGRLFGVMKGNQPPGTMTVQTIPHSVVGFEHCGTLQITYTIPHGTQNVSLSLKLLTVILYHMTILQIN